MVIALRHQHSSEQAVQWPDEQGKHTVKARDAVKLSSDAAAADLCAETRGSRGKGELRPLC